MTTADPSGDNEREGTYDIEVVARRFHEAYEELAPHFEWTTQMASRVSWDQLPDNQQSLMMEVVELLIREGTIHR